MSEKVFTSCTVGGPISVYVKDGKIVRVRPLVVDKNDLKPWTIEAKGKKFSPPKQVKLAPFTTTERIKVDSEERIKYPMKRVDFDPKSKDRRTQNRGKSGYERIGWDEALNIISSEIKKILESLGAETVIDSAGDKIGGSSGNLIAKFKGNKQAPPLLLNAHMDTVEPGKGITAVLKEGIFTSDGTTILGADDKSAIAIILETIKIIQENNLPYGPIEIVLTVCEEIGLLGAKHLDLSLINAEYGYALDATDTWFPRGRV